MAEEKKKDWSSVKFKVFEGIDDIFDYVRTLRKEYFLKEIDDLTPGYSGKMYVFKRLVEYFSLTIFFIYP